MAEVKSLHQFKYVCGMSADTFCERIYKTEDGLYKCVVTRRFKNGDYGKQKVSYGRIPPGKKAIKWNREKEKPDAISE